MRRAHNILHNITYKLRKQSPFLIYCITLLTYCATFGLEGASVKFVSKRQVLAPTSPLHLPSTCRSIYCCIIYKHRWVDISERLPCPSVRFVWYVVLKFYKYITTQGLQLLLCWHQLSGVNCLQNSVDRLCRV